MTLIRISQRLTEDGWMEGGGGGAAALNWLVVVVSISMSLGARLRVI